MSFSDHIAGVKHRHRHGASYVSTARPETSLRIGSSRSIEVCGGGAGIGAEEAGASGISAMQTYPARRAMYSQSTMAKYASVIRKTPAITSRHGAIWMKASGTDTAVVATLKATRCASPVHVPTAKTGPDRSRKKATAAEIAPSVSSPSRMAKTLASDNNQFRAGHAMQINPASTRNNVKTRPGRGCALDDRKPARIEAPTMARIAARLRARRKKLRPTSERQDPSSIESGAGVETLLATSRRKYSSRARTVAARPMEAATIQSNDKAISANSAASTARFMLPRRICSIARPTSKGCLVERRAASPLVTGSVPRNSISQKNTSAQPTAPTVQRHAISAKASEGRRKLARKPSSVGETRGMNLSHHEVDQLARNEDCFHDLLARDRRLHFLIGERALDDEIFGCIGGHDHAAAQLAIDLHRNFQFFFFGKLRVIFWPRRFEQVSLFTEHLPEFVGEIGSEGREQQNKVALHVGQKWRRDGVLCYRVFHVIQHIHQLHDRRDAGIEVPAPLKVIAYAFDGLVELALDLPCLWRERRRRQRLYGCTLRAASVSGDETIHFAQKSLYASDAGVLPV